MKLVFVVKRIRNSKNSLKKVWKLQISYSEFDCLTGFSDLFLLFETYFFLMFSFLCYLPLRYLIRNQLSPAL